ncbi:MAG: hypothetical protein IJ125_05590 [Atopobiaceae bacterium]|nr:hypothetical protein [Atopobiaceae bacterium]
MTDTEKLALMVALDKAIQEQLDSRNKDSLRHIFNQKMMQDYTLTGQLSKEIRVNNMVVGKAIVCAGKPKVREAYQSFECYDMDALRAWDDSDFHQFIIAWLFEHMDVIAEDYCEATGEVPEGCKLVDHEKLVMESDPYVQLRIKREDVAQAFGPSLSGAVAGLLEA